MTQPPPYPGDLGPGQQPQPTYGQPPPQRAPGVPDYSRPLRPPTSAHSLSIATIIIAAAFTLHQVIEAVLAWPAQQEYQDAADNGVMGVDVWTAYDLVAIPILPLMIAMYVITCVWLFKVRTNHEALYPGAHQKRSKGWVWGGWICPIVSLWFPFQVIRDVSREPRESWSTDAKIGWWWAAWLLALFTGQIGTSLVPLDELDRGTVSALGTVETINAALVVAAFILWTLAIRQITHVQAKALERTAP